MVLSSPARHLGRGGAFRTEGGGVAAVGRDPLALAETIARPSSTPHRDRGQGPVAPSTASAGGLRSSPRENTTPPPACTAWLPQHLKASDHGAAAADAVAASLAAGGERSPRRTRPAWECAVFAHAVWRCDRTPRSSPTSETPSPRLPDTSWTDPWNNSPTTSWPTIVIWPPRCLGNLAARDVSFSLNNVARLRQHRSGRRVDLVRGIPHHPP